MEGARFGAQRLLRFNAIGDRTEERPNYLAGMLFDSARLEQPRRNLRSASCYRSCPSVPLDGLASSSLPPGSLHTWMTAPGSHSGDLCPLPPARRYQRLVRSARQQIVRPRTIRLGVMTGKLAPGPVLARRFTRRWTIPNGIARTGCARLACSGSCSVTRSYLAAERQKLSRLIKANP